MFNAIGASYGLWWCCFSSHNNSQVSKLKRDGANTILFSGLRTQSNNLWILFSKDLKNCQFWPIFYINLKKRSIGASYGLWWCCFSSHNNSQVSKLKRDGANTILFSGLRTQSNNLWILFSKDLKNCQFWPIFYINLKKRSIGASYDLWWRCFSSHNNSQVSKLKRDGATIILFSRLRTQSNNL